MVLMKTFVMKMALMMKSDNFIPILMKLYLTSPLRLSLCLSGCGKIANGTKKANAVGTKQQLHPGQKNTHGTKKNRHRVQKKQNRDKIKNAFGKKALFFLDFFLFSFFLLLYLGLQLLRDFF